MSKNITIQEGGVDKALNSIKKIQTAKQGGGSVLWVPEEEVQLTTKTIKKNGTYKASDDGYYGYSKVTVKGVGKATGKDNSNPDDPNDYDWSSDGNGGVNKTKLPTRIVLTSLPVKTTYTEGESISISGIGVRAYCADGSIYGDVNTSELTYEPTTAVIRSHSDLFEMCSTLGIGSEVFFRYGISAYGEDPNNPAASQYNGNSDILYLCVVHEEGVGYYGGCFSATSGTATYKEIGGSAVMVYDLVLSNGVYYYYDNNTVSDTSSSFNNYYPVIEKSVIDEILSGQGSTITVKWERPGDGKVLSTTFNITVNASSGSQSPSTDQTDVDPDSGGGGSHGF